MSGGEGGSVGEEGYESYRGLNGVSYSCSSPGCPTGSSQGMMVGRRRSGKPTGVIPDPEEWVGTEEGPEEE